MKKFIIFQISLVIVGAILCTVFCSMQTNQGFTEIHTYSELITLDANPSPSYEEDVALNQSVEEYLDWIIGLYEYKKPEYEKLIIIAEAQDEFSLYNQCINQKIKIDKVIDGDNSFLGQTVDLLYRSGFYYETDEDTENRIYRMQVLGQKITDDDQEKQLILDLGSLNVMKPGHKYLIFAQMLNFDDYTVVCADRHQYTWMDISDSESTPVEYDMEYSQCSDNEIFSYSQNVIDDYYRLKNEVFEYYGINN